MFFPFAVFLLYRLLLLFVRICFMYAAPYQHLRYPLHSAIAGGSYSQPPVIINPFGKREYALQQPPVKNSGVPFHRI